MSVIRIKKARSKPYVVIDTTALNDARLSFRAKGLHTYLMAKPDDWRVNADALARQSPKEGREAIMSALRELTEAGYIRRSHVRDHKGHLLGTDTVVYETPTLASQDDADEELGAAAIGLSESAEDDQIRITYQPKVGKPESRTNRSRQNRDSGQPKSANPTLLINVSTQYGEVPSIDLINTPSSSLRSEEPPQPEISAPEKESSHKKAKRQTDHFFPDDFPREPPEDFLSWSTEECPGVDVRAEWKKMLDHEFERPKSDWGRTAKRWMRNAPQFNGNGARASPSPVMGKQARIEANNVDAHYTFLAMMRKEIDEKQ